MDERGEVKCSARVVSIRSDVFLFVFKKSRRIGKFDQIVNQRSPCSTEISRSVRRSLQEVSIERFRSDWEFNYDSFNHVSSSHEFEERYTPNWAELYESSETTRETKSSLSSESSVLLYPSKNVRFRRLSDRLDAHL